MSWEEEDRIDEETTAHRADDECVTNVRLAT
jgi:hypothetical protein